MTNARQEALRTISEMPAPKAPREAFNLTERFGARVFNDAVQRRRLRPDVYQAELEVAAASAEVGSARADRYPRLTLSGTIAAGYVRTVGAGMDAPTWQIGPLAVSLPVFDGGRRAAAADAALARYDEAAALYRARVRNAVQEVENALVALQSTADRAADARTASDGFAASLRATQARFSGGLASLFELEDARRSAVQAQVALIDLQRERSTAWIDLYRALGGGWSAADVALATQP